MDVELVVVDDNLNIYDNEVKIRLDFLINYNEGICVVTLPL